MQLLSTQWSCSQVNIQLSYIGVPYRLTSRMICRTICCKHMSAKNWNLKVKMTTTILLSIRLRSSTTTPYLSVWSIRWRETSPRLRFGVWRLHWNHVFVIIDHSVLGASCHVNTQSSCSVCKHLKLKLSNCWIKTSSTITLDLWSPKSQLTTGDQADRCLSNRYHSTEELKCRMIQVWLG